VLKSPEPNVVFKDFGDNALLFELNFWLAVGSLPDRGKVESDVRFMIDAAFREAKISIPYPQRDVHLDTSQPLDVRLLAPTDGKDAKKSSGDDPAVGDKPTAAA